MRHDGSRLWPQNSVLRHDKNSLKNKKYQKIKIEKSKSK
jgi:hypothetical protein